MSALRILLISILLAGLLVSSPACDSFSFCVPFTGRYGCIKTNYTEPNMPPIDNNCCGPHCRYTPLNGEPGICNSTARFRCLLDTHCMGNIEFSYQNMSDCEFRAMNDNRAATGYARVLSFDWTEATCLAQQYKCGLNCCCRETCPTKFCSVETATACP